MPSLIDALPCSETLLSLGIKRDPTYRVTFENALLRGDRSQRVVAARALGWLRAPECVPALLRSLNDPKPDVRRWICASLSLCWAEHADVNLIRHFLSENEGMVRAAILRTLGWHRQLSAAQICVSALSDDESPEVRCEAAKALGRIDPHTHISYLLEATKDIDPSVRRHALRGLTDCVMSTSMPSTALPFTSTCTTVTTLLNHAYHDEDAEARSVALRVLTHHPSPEVYECLKQSLEDLNPCVRVNAVVALGQRGHPETTSLLRDRLNDPHPEVRARAMEAIKIIRTTSRIRHTKS